MDHSGPGVVRAPLTLAVTVPALTTPILFHVYWVFVYTLLNHSYTFGSIQRLGTWVYIAMLGLLGVGIVIGRSRGLRVSPAVASGGLLVLPWLTLTTEIGSPGYPAFVFVAFVVSAVTEWQVRGVNEYGLLEFRGTTGGKYALLAGTAHFLLGFGLQIYVRRLALVDPMYGMRGILIGLLIYAVAGAMLFATGAIPVIVWIRERLITPAAVTVGWISWGVYEIWIQRDRFPLGDFAGIAWVSGVPDPDYMLQITVLLVAVLLVAGIEFLARKVAARVGTLSGRGGAAK